MKKLILLFSSFISFSLFGQNLPPTLSGVQVSLGPNNMLTINYDLADAENDASTVTFRATAKGGLTFDYNTANATGNVGAGITPGTGKQIVWDFTAYATAQPDFRLMLVADDSQTVDIQALVDAVDSTRLLADLTFIQGKRHRTTGAVHLQEVKDLIFNHFADHQLETYKQEFAFGGYQAANIIGRQTGTGNEASVYILDGHFDSVDNGPGADDNGSAVAGFMEAVRILAPYSFKKSIKYIGFDLEEANLTGSVRYNQNGILPGESIAGVLNFEMIGYYSEKPNSQTLPAGFGVLFPDAYNKVLANEFRGDFITSVGIENAVPLMNAYENAAATYVPGLKVISVKAPPNWQIVTPDLGRSDHAPFWVANRPALMLTDGANFRNPNYHTPNDRADSLNFTFMRQVVQAAIATLAEVAEIQHADTWWADTEFFTNTEETAGCEIRLAPNPARDFVQIEFGNCGSGAFTVDILDLTGRIVGHHQFNGIADASLELLNVQSLHPGLYFLRTQGAFWASVQKVILY